MQKHSKLTEGRIQRFIQYELLQRQFGETTDLQLEICGQAFENRNQAARGKYVPIKTGQAWGPANQAVWFRVAGRVPAAWKGQEVVVLLDTGSECTVWGARGPEWGLDQEHRYHRLVRKAKGGERYSWYLQAYGASPNVSWDRPPVPTRARPFVLGEARLAVFDREIRNLYLDCRFYYELLKTLPDQDPNRARLLRVLNEAVNEFQPEDRAGIRSIRASLAAIAGGVDSAHTVTPVGHAHLDTAWLWPLQTTHHKLAHTVANQLNLLEDYPEYLFVHSQACQYEWLEREYPDLFKRVRSKIKQGRWEALGSLWVEADTNLTGGESLVRQVMRGKRYFKERFGLDTKELWLPDCFGYSGALPQILAGCGVDSFLSQKLSWNQFNHFPHNSFYWQGIDGTRIFTHFPPADTYNGDCSPEQLRRHVDRYRDHARSDRALYVFGFGDGGGGPTEEHLEFLRRAEKAPGLPAIKRQSVKEFFQEARAKAQDLQVWVGELYLEYHRGTYTTQANVKRMNRECEFLLRDAECLACMNPGYPRDYPVESLDDLWKGVLLNQFHDILPGSSIQEVYDGCARDYSRLQPGIQALIDESLRQLAGVAGNMAMFQFVSAGVSAQGQIKPPAGSTPKSLVCGDEVLPVQKIDAFGEKSLIFAVPRAAQSAVAVGEFSKQTAEAKTFKTGPRLLESEDWQVRFDARGHIRSLVSKQDGFDYVAQDENANEFQIFEDKPLTYNAWDVDRFALETKKALSACDRMALVETGPVRVAMEVERSFGNSRILQVISLGPTPGVRFDTQVDWHEDEKLLKVAFPVRINPGPATYEIQFGNVQRPTHENTSWDMARFEVCAHKWADLSQGDRGVALLNDGQYGYDIRGNVMRLTLLRAPVAPDPTADRGRHRFCYTLLPHQGNYQQGRVVQAGYALNAPLRTVPLQRITLSRGRGERHSNDAGGMPRASSAHTTSEIALTKAGRSSPEALLQIDHHKVVLETVKKAEDSNAIILRLYDPHNAAGTATLRFPRWVNKVLCCDLMENEQSELKRMRGAFQLDFRPFEIITLKVPIPNVVKSKR